MELANLSHDVLTELLRYLDAAHCTQKLRLTGDKVILRAVERRTSAFFFTSQKSNSVPSELVSLTMLRNLEIGSSEPYKTSLYLQIEAFPRSLTRLVLKDLVDIGMAFVAYDPSDSLAKIASLDEQLPLLTTLKLTTSSRVGYWALPSALSCFHGYGAQFHPDIALPPRLAHISQLMGDDESLVRDKLAPRLESIEFLHVNQSNLIPHLPSLTYLYFDTDFDLTSIHQQFPSLKYALLPKSRADFCPWLFPHLVYFSVHKAIKSSDLSKMPQSITKWTSSDYSDVRFLQPVHPKAVSRLPRSLNTLRFSNYPVPLLDDITNHLPSGLTRLDARGVSLLPSQFQFFPTTLTSLQVNNITRHNVIHLERLKLLMHLGWFDGVLETKVVRLLPRRLQSLELVHVALRTHGHYQEPKTKIYRKFSTLNPQVTVLKGNLPSLRKLLIKPHPSHAYYSLYTAEILADLPVSLEELILDWEFKPINFFPAFNEELRYSQPDPYSSLTPYWNSKNDLEATTLFKHLVNLKHLYINCTSPKNHDPASVLRGLPHQIELLHLPRFMFERSATLLRDHAYLPKLVRCSSVSLLYLTVNSAVGVTIKTYEGYSGIKPAEPEFSLRL